MADVERNITSASSNRNNGHDGLFEDEDDSFGPCDCTSYSYFSLALLLFVTGTTVTVLALKDTNTDVPNFGHMWLIGPLLISSGLMVAVKTLIYLKRKTLIAFLTRQQLFVRDLRCESLPSMPSLYSLPPPYESIASSVVARISLWPTNQFAHEISSSNINNATEDFHEAPPAYEDVISETVQMDVAASHPYAELRGIERCKGGS